MDPIDIDKLKRALRKQGTAARDAMAPADRALASVHMAANRAGVIGAHSGSIVSAYQAMGSEIDPAGLIERLAREGVRTCLPVIQPLGQPLVFRAWAAGDTLVPRKWGIREPADDAPIVEPDVLLVPLLAFDRRGFRLGYGGGYYDRTLARLRAMKPVTAIGLAYTGQEMDEVPRGPHDQRLDWVLTESGYVQFQSGFRSP